MLETIRQLKRTLAVLVLANFAALFAMPTLTLAEESATPSAETLANQAKEEAHATIDLVLGALKGEEGALNELIRDKVVPAIVLLAGLIIAWTITSSVGRYVGGMVAKKVDRTLGKFLTKAVRNLLMMLVVLGVLGHYEVDVTSFAAILAAMGFAVGMALQGTLGNFASGIMLLLFRPFKVDDYVAVADTEGAVEEIDLFTTRLNTPDNRHIIIPNSEIFGNKLINYSRNEVRRVDVNVGAAYSADIEFTRAALMRAIANTGGVESPEGYVYLKELGASSVDWQLRVWCSPADYWAVREQLTANAKIELDRAGIGIPYPQLDVHVGGKLLAKAA